MRYLVRVLGVCLLLLIPFFACMDFGDGETEGCGPYNFDLNGDPCRGVLCPPDANECTREYCSGGACQSSPVTDGTSCAYDGREGVCVAGVCGENLCEGVVCDDEPCSTGRCDYVDGLCDYDTTLPNGTPCTYDGLEGICVNGVCGENPCAGVVCDDGDPCTEGRCDYVDGTCDFAPLVCDDHEECTEDSCDPTHGCVFTAVEDGTECGTDGLCEAGSCVWPPYMQDFESLDQSSPTALSDDGWIVFGAVFTPDGTTYLYGYSFSAPNNIGGFCGIASGQGGPEQGDQQLLIISDYNNLDEQNAGNRVQASTYRERPITVNDVGKTVVFSFDARRGNINDPADPGCIESANPPCDSTADAFIKTVDPDAGFAITNAVEEDTTSIPETWARYSLSFTINPGLVGQLLQVGFSATASNFEPSGVFYDNVLVETGAVGTGGTGGSGGAGGTGGTAGSGGVGGNGGVGGG